MIDTYVLVIVGFLELVVHVLLQNHMASRAGHRLLTSGYFPARPVISFSPLIPSRSTRAPTRTFDVQVVFPRDVDNVVSLVGLDGDDFAVWLFEMQRDPACTEMMVSGTALLVFLGMELLTLRRALAVLCRRAEPLQKM